MSQQQSVRRLVKVVVKGSKVAYDIGAEYPYSLPKDDGPDYDTGYSPIENLVYSSDGMLFLELENGVAIGMPVEVEELTFIKYVPKIAVPRKELVV